MTRVLLTAFEPYDRWTENSSWQALIELTSWYDGPGEVFTRRYPVDLTAMSGLLRKDLQSNYDIALHVGQSPGAAVVELEAVGLNVRSDGSPLVADAPEAFRSQLPLDTAVKRLHEAGIPAAVSHHAGTFLCNAALYLSQYYCSLFGMRTRSVFIHLPLAPAQVAKDSEKLASLSTPMASAAIALMVQEFIRSTQKSAAMNQST